MVIVHGNLDVSQKSHGGADDKVLVINIEDKELFKSKGLSKSYW